MNQLYSKLLLAHSKNKTHRKIIEDYSFKERGHNPNCGDDLSLYLKVNKNIVVDASYEGVGCAISQASMSIMIDLIKNKNIEEVKNIMNIFFDMIKGEQLDDKKIELLDNAYIFESIKSLAGRIKCVTLGWHCLKLYIESENV